MATKIVIDRTPWIDKLEAVSAKRILSVLEMSREIGMHYGTLLSFMDRDSKVKTNPKTIRRIDEYIKQCER